MKFKKIVSLQDPLKIVQPIFESCIELFGISLAYLERQERSGVTCFSERSVQLRSTREECVSKRMSHEKFCERFSFLEDNDYVLVTYDASKNGIAVSLQKDEIIPKLGLPDQFPLSKQTILFTSLYGREVSLEFSYLSKENVEKEIQQRRDKGIDSPEKLRSYITDEGLIKCIKIRELDSEKLAYFSIDPIDYQGIFEFLAVDASYRRPQEDITHLFSSEFTPTPLQRVESLAYSRLTNLWFIPESKQQPAFNLLMGILELKRKILKLKRENFRQSIENGSSFSRMSESSDYYKIGNSLAKYINRLAGFQKMVKGRLTEMAGAKLIEIIKSDDARDNTLILAALDKVIQLFPALNIKQLFEDGVLQSERGLEKDSDEFKKVSHLLGLYKERQKLAGKFFDLGVCPISLMPNSFFNQDESEATLIRNSDRDIEHQVYHRAAIEKWVTESSRTSPITRKPIAELVPIKDKAVSDTLIELGLIKTGKHLEDFESELSLLKSKINDITQKIIELQDQVGVNEKKMEELAYLVSLPQIRNHLLPFDKGEVKVGVDEKGQSFLEINIQRPGNPADTDIEDDGRLLGDDDPVGYLTSRSMGSTRGTRDTSGVHTQPYSTSEKEVVRQTSYDFETITTTYLDAKIKFSNDDGKRGGDSDTGIHPEINEKLLKLEAEFKLNFTENEDSKYLRVQLGRRVEEENKWSVGRDPIQRISEVRVPTGKNPLKHYLQYLGHFTTHIELDSNVAIELYKLGGVKRFDGWESFMVQIHSKADNSAIMVLYSEEKTYLIGGCSGGIDVTEIQQMDVEFSRDDDNPVGEWVIRKPVIYLNGYNGRAKVHVNLTTDELEFCELIPEFNASLTNINTATEKELILLPGISTVLAKRIILKRQDSLFTSIQELTSIKGLGKQTFDKVKPFITVDKTNNSAQYWDVIADGTGGVQLPTKERYPYLFWEATRKTPMKVNLENAHCIQKDHLAEYLEKALRQFGLNDTEQKDFIEFWVPLLKDRPEYKAYNYVVIEFLEERYTDTVDMSVYPKSDQEIRVFALFELSLKPMLCGNPTLKTVERKQDCRVVVEWGGAEWIR